MTPVSQQVVLAVDGRMEPREGLEGAASLIDRCPMTCVLGYPTPFPRPGQADHLELIARGVPPCGAGSRAASFREPRWPPASSASACHHLLAPLLSSSHSRQAQPLHPSVPALLDSCHLPLSLPSSPFSLLALSVSLTILGPRGAEHIVLPKQGTSQDGSPELSEGNSLGFS